MTGMTSRGLISITAAGAATLALAACGDGDGGGGDAAASPRERAQEGALAFARCMREQGVDFPDPRVGEGGMVMIGPGPGRGGDGGPNPEDPKTRRAAERCEQHLEGGGEPPDDVTAAKFRDAFVAYARCMRAEGVEVPDPGADGGLRFRVGDPDAPDLDSPAFRAADGACRKHLAAVDAEVTREGPE
jgi:hypothetical protein